MRLFYFVTDTYPVWRVDLAELFSVELRKFELHTDWSVRAEKTGMWQTQVVNGETYYLPLTLSGIPLLSPILRRLTELLAELFLMAKLVFGPRYDVVQVRDDRYTAAIFAWIAARIRGSHFTYWLSYPFPENDLDKAEMTLGPRKYIFKWRGKLMQWWLYKVVLVAADHVFVQTEHMKANMVAYGVDGRKMTAVPMGVSTRLFEWRANTVTAVEKERVVYLGSFARSRRLEMLIDAMATVVKQRPDAKLYMVGRGDTPEDRAILEDRVMQLGIGPHVEFTGFVPIDVAWTIAAKAAVCVSPIYPTFIFNQASPTKLYEYMALGRPVIANEHPDQSRTLEESGAGICVPWSADHFAEAIVTLLQDTAQAECMAKKGPAWADSHRRYDKIAVMVFQQYQKMMR
jgi:glycosyltransferase involved in cell wall biosynthesis